MCFPFLTVFKLENNTRYKYVECRLENMNHVRILGNYWINSFDNSDIFSGVFLWLVFQKQHPT